ncbi:MAG: lytic transglycosylase domain-containing protein [Proteobacteria bacterium]|nr:lytic transglycosylase domain-containing protein [Pseudomonadota bacterium]
MSGAQFSSKTRGIHPGRGSSARALCIPHGQLPTFHPLSRRQRTSSGSDSLVWLLSIVAALYAAAVVATFAFLAVSKHSFRSEQATVQSAKVALPTLFRPTSRDAFLRQLNFQYKRELNTKINYVADKISAVGKLESSKAVNLAKLIVLESYNQNIDPLFVAAVIKKESTFKTHARSHRGATGLMQLMPRTGEHLSRQEGVAWEGLGSLQDPTTNIRLGIAYIKELKASFRGNAEHALIAYNWGPSNLSRALKNRSPIPSSTVNYARGVIKDHKSWSIDLKNQRAQYRYMSMG